MVEYNKERNDGMTLESAQHEFWRSEFLKVLCIPLGAIFYETLGTTHNIIDEHFN